MNRACVATSGAWLVGWDGKLTRNWQIGNSCLITYPALRTREEWMKRKRGLERTFVWSQETKTHKWTWFGTTLKVKKRQEGQKDRRQKREVKWFWSCYESKITRRSTTWAVYLQAESVRILELSKSKSRLLKTSWSSGLDGPPKPRCLLWSRAWEQATRSRDLSSRLLWTAKRRLDPVIWSPMECRTSTSWDGSKAFDLETRKLDARASLCCRSFEIALQTLRQEVESFPNCSNVMVEVNRSLIERSGVMKLEWTESIDLAIKLETTADCLIRMPGDEKVRTWEIE